MAAATNPDEVLQSTLEKENFQRLARLLISGGTTLLVEIFDARCPPSILPTILNNPATVKLLKAAKLTKTQWDCLYPSPGVYGKASDFDVTLLFRLLKTICNLIPPVTGWDVLPTSTDHSLTADLARIKYYRNSVYAHVSQNMEITSDEFLPLWNNISTALVRIAGQISHTKKMEWQDAIDKFLKDPLTAEAERNVEELCMWYKTDMEVKEHLEELKATTHETAQDVKDILLQLSCLGGLKAERLHVALDKDVMEYITTKPFYDQLQNLLIEKNCEMTWKPKRKIAVIVYRGEDDSDSWQSECIDEVQNFICKFTHCDVEVNKDFWKAVVAQLSDVRACLGADPPLVKTIDDSFVARIVSLSTDVKDYKKKLKAKLEEIYREETRKTYLKKTVPNVPEEKLILLKNIKFVEKLREKNKELEIKLDVENEEIYFEGPRLQFIEATMQFFQQLSDMVERKLTLSNNILDVLGSDKGLQKVKREFANNNVEAVFVINDKDARIIGTSATHADNAVRHVDKLMLEEKVQLDKKSKYLVTNYGQTISWRTGTIEMEQILREIVQKWLQKGEEIGASSIAIPVIGAGKLSCPPDAAARIMLEEACNFGQANADSNVQEIRFVVDQHDPALTAAFKEETSKLRAKLSVKSDFVKTLFFYSGIALPQHWSPMPRPDTTVHLVSLSQSFSEYQDVAHKFQATARGINIQKIERIQNPHLYKSYMESKQKMDKCIGGNSELQLFHGSAAENITYINTQGFNSQRLSSEFACGRGVYFTTDASNSVRYTGRGGGDRHMYLARVLVGQCCAGNSSMIVPPPKSASRPEVLYESVVDNPGNPSTFVVFSENQCYPEYLITMQ